MGQKECIWPCPLSALARCDVLSSCKKVNECWRHHFKLLFTVLVEQSQNEQLIIEVVDVAILAGVEASPHHPSALAQQVVVCSESLSP
jgi:hypothetical protein